MFEASQNKNISSDILSSGKRVVILSPTASQPRFHRRARMLQEAGYKVTVYTFNRGFYRENTYPENIEVTYVGKISEGNYLLRIPKLLLAIHSIRKCEIERGQSPSFIYAFALDMALIAEGIRQKNTPFVYEVADLRNPLPHGSFFSKLLAKVEMCVLTKAALLVVTSPGFLKHYYERIYPGIESKSVIIENKASKEISARFARPQRPITIERPIKIGFVGLLRYEKTLVPLIDAVAQKNGDFELHLFGDGPLRNVVEDKAARYSNICYHGSFKNPDDLQRIYNSIDLGYVVYDNRNVNVRIALPNKLYESPYFGVPLVVADDTMLADKVRELGIGFVVDPRQQDFAKKLLLELNAESVSKASERSLLLPQSLLIENYDKVITKFAEL